VRVVRIVVVIMCSKRRRRRIREIGRLNAWS
jgi:hypothetical protein